MAVAHALVTLQDGAVLPALTDLATTGCELYANPFTGQDESESTVAHLAILRLADLGSAAAEEAAQALHIRPACDAGGGRERTGTDWSTHEPSCNL